MTLYQISVIYELLTLSFILYLLKKYIFTFFSYIKGIYLIILMSINNLLIDFKTSILGEIYTPHGVKYILNGLGIKYFTIHKKRFNKKIYTPFSYNIKYNNKKFELYLDINKKWYIYINKKLYRIRSNHKYLLKIINPTVYNRIYNKKK